MRAQTRPVRMQLQHTVCVLPALLMVVILVAPYAAQAAKDEAYLRLMKQRRDQQLQQFKERARKQVNLNYKRGRDLVTAPTIEETFVDSDLAYAACPKPGQPLIMAMTSYSVEALCPFVHSISIHSPEAKLVLFTDNDQLEGQMAPICLNKANVHVLLAKTKPTPGVTWHFWRYFLYHNFLSMCRSRQGQRLGPVMVADSRDAVVQGDVFQHPQFKRAVRERGVIFSLEGNVGAYGEPDLLRQDAMAGNYFMMRGHQVCWHDMLSPQEWGDFMSGNYYSCSGVTMGDGDAMLHYSRAMVDFMLNRAPERCLRHIGGDQHVHAMLMFAKMNSSLALGPVWDTSRFNFTAMVMYNGVGAPVYSVAMGRPIQMDEQGVIWVKREGYTLRPMFVHQHDRIKDVAARINALYPCEITPAQREVIERNISSSATLDFATPVIGAQSRASSSKLSITARSGSMKVIEGQDGSNVNSQSEGNNMKTGDSSKDSVSETGGNNSGYYRHVQATLDVWNCKDLGRAISGCGLAMVPLVVFVVYSVWSRKSQQQPVCMHCDRC